MKIPNLREMVWISPPDRGGENASSVMRRYMEFIGWKNGDNPCIIYVGSESQIEKGIEAKVNFPHIPLVLNFWGWMPERFMNEQWRKIYAEKIELIQKIADMITVPNLQSAEQLRILGITKRIDIAPPGADTLGLLIAQTESRKFLKNEQFFLSIGRLVPHKNFQLVIEALKDTEYKYVIIGSGELKDNLEAMAKEYKVKLTISQNTNDLEKGELIALAKAVIVPSAYEGFGLPIVEACTLNTPVIANDIPAFRELFGDNLEYFKTENELKSALTKLMEFEDYRKEVLTKEAILGMKYSGFTQSLSLNNLFVDIIATMLKEKMKKEYEAGNNSLQEVYNFDALMDKTYFKYRLDPNTQLFFFRVNPVLANLKGKNVLDIGSSTGIFAVYMAQAGFEVSCVDIADEYLKIVNELADKYSLKDRISTYLHDATLLEKIFKQDSFDNVWIGEIIEHFENSTVLIRQTMRVLKPGGRILLTVPYQDACYDAFHMRQFTTEEDIKAIFKEFPNFEFKEIKKIGSPGGKHNNWFAWGVKK